jgi:cytochrome c5
VGAADPARRHPAEAGVRRVRWTTVGWAKARSGAPCPPGLARGGHAEPVIGPAEGRTRWLCPPYGLSLFGLTILAGLGVAQATRAAESDLVEQGRDLYADTCAMCHGRDMVNAGGIAFDLRKFPRDDFARFRNSVLNGKNQAMPAWRDKIDDNDLAALWAYVRSGG